MLKELRVFFSLRSFGVCECARAWAAFPTEELVGGGGDFTAKSGLWEICMSRRMVLFCLTH